MAEVWATASTPPHGVHTARASTFVGLSPITPQEVPEAWASFLPYYGARGSHLRVVAPRRASFGRSRDGAAERMQAERPASAVAAAHLRAIDSKGWRGGVRPHPAVLVSHKGVAPHPEEPRHTMANRCPGPVGLGKHQDGHSAHRRSLSRRGALRYRGAAHRHGRHTRRRGQVLRERRVGCSRVVRGADRIPLGRVAAVLGRLRRPTEGPGRAGRGSSCVPDKGHRRGQRLCHRRAVVLRGAPLVQLGRHARRDRDLGSRRRRFSHQLAAFRTRRRQGHRRGICQLGGALRRTSAAPLGPRTAARGQQRATSACSPSIVGRVIGKALLPHGAIGNRFRRRDHGVPSPCQQRNSPTRGRGARRRYTLLGCHPRTKAPTGRPLGGRYGGVRLAHHWHPTDGHTPCGSRRRGGVWAGTQTCQPSPGVAAPASAAAHAHRHVVRPSAAVRGRTVAGHTTRGHAGGHGSAGAHRRAQRGGAAARLLGEAGPRGPFAYRIGGVCRPIGGGGGGGGGLGRTLEGDASAPSTPPRSSCPVPYGEQSWLQLSGPVLKKLYVEARLAQAVAAMLSCPSSRQSVSGRTAARRIWVEPLSPLLSTRSRLTSHEQVVRVSSLIGTACARDTLRRWGWSRPPRAASLARPSQTLAHRMWRRAASGVPPPPPTPPWLVEAQRAAEPGQAPYASDRLR